MGVCLVYIETKYQDDISLTSPVMFGLTVSQYAEQCGPGAGHLNSKLRVGCGAAGPLRGWEGGWRGGGPLSGLAFNILIVCPPIFTSQIQMEQTRGQMYYNQCSCSVHDSLLCSYR